MDAEADGVSDGIEGNGENESDTEGDVDGVLEFVPSKPMPKRLPGVRVLEVGTDELDADADAELDELNAADAEDEFVAYDVKDTYAVTV